MVEARNILSMHGITFSVDEKGKVSYSYDLDEIPYQSKDYETEFSSQQAISNYWDSLRQIYYTKNANTGKYEFPLFDRD